MTDFHCIKCLTAKLITWYLYHEIIPALPRNIQFFYPDYFNWKEEKVLGWKKSKHQENLHRFL